MEEDDVKAVETDEAEAPETVEMVEYADGQHFEVRTLTPSDWAKVGVEDGKLIHWHKGNQFRVPRSEFDFLSAEQFDQYIMAEPRMRLVEVEK